MRRLREAMMTLRFLCPLELGRQAHTFRGPAILHPTHGWLQPLKILHGGSCLSYENRQSARRDTVRRRSDNVPPQIAIPDPSNVRSKAVSLSHCAVTRSIHYRVPVRFFLLRVSDRFLHLLDLRRLSLFLCDCYWGGRQGQTSLNA